MEDGHGDGHEDEDFLLEDPPRRLDSLFLFSCRENEISWGRNIIR